MYSGFIESEFWCPCCHKLPVFGMSTKLVKLLNDLRYKVGKPVFVSSGYRCDKHNAEVGGVPKSYHCLGMAADIFVPGLSSSDLFEVCKDVGFTGIGIYSTFVHVDVRDSDEIIIFYGE